MVVVDEGSTDGTQVVVEEFIDLCVGYLQHERNWREPRRGTPISGQRAEGIRPSWIPTMNGLWKS